MSDTKAKKAKSLRQSEISRMAELLLTAQQAVNDPASRDSLQLRYGDVERIRDDFFKHHNIVIGSIDDEQEEDEFKTQDQIRTQFENKPTFFPTDGDVGLTLPFDVPLHTYESNSKPFFNDKSLQREEPRFYVDEMNVDTESEKEEEQEEAELDYPDDESILKPQVIQAFDEEKGDLDWHHDVDSYVLVVKNLQALAIHSTFYESMDARKAKICPQKKVTSALFGDNRKKWLEFTLGSACDHHIKCVFQYSPFLNVNVVRQLFIEEILQKAINDALLPETNTITHGSGDNKFGTRLKISIFRKDWPAVAREVDRIINSRVGYRLLRMCNVHYYTARHGQREFNFDQAKHFLTSSIEPGFEHMLVGLQMHCATQISSKDSGAVFVRHDRMGKFIGKKFTTNTRPAFLKGLGHTYGNIIGHNDVLPNVTYFQSFKTKAFSSPATFLLGRGMNKFQKNAIKNFAIIKPRTLANLRAMISTIESYQTNGYRLRIETVETFRDLKNFNKEYLHSDSFVKKRMKVLTEMARAGALVRFSGSNWRKHLEACGILYDVERVRETLNLFQSFDESQRLPTMSIKNIIIGDEFLTDEIVMEEKERARAMTKKNIRHSERLERANFSMIPQENNDEEYASSNNGGPIIMSSIEVVKTYVSIMRITYFLEGSTLRGKKLDLDVLKHLLVRKMRGQVQCVKTVDELFNEFIPVMRPQEATIPGDNFQHYGIELRGFLSPKNVADNFLHPKSAIGNWVLSSTRVSSAKLSDRIFYKKLLDYIKNNVPIYPTQPKEQSEQMPEEEIIQTEKEDENQHKTNIEYHENHQEEFLEVPGPSKCQAQTTSESGSPIKKRKRAMPLNAIEIRTMVEHLANNVANREQIWKFANMPPSVFEILQHRRYEILWRKANFILYEATEAFFDKNDCDAAELGLFLVCNNNQTNMGKIEKIRKFNSSWLSESWAKGWLVDPGPAKCGEAFCKICKSTIRAHKADLIRHTKSKLHLSECSKINVRREHQITKHITVISSEAKIKDLIIAAHIACHSSITSVDHLGELLNNLKITSKNNSIRQHRTKCTALIKNVIYPSLLEDLLEDVGDAKITSIYGINGDQEIAEKAENQESGVSTNSKQASDSSGRVAIPFEFELNKIASIEDSIEPEVTGTASDIITNKRKSLQSQLSERSAPALLNSASISASTSENPVTPKLNKKKLRAIALILYRGFKELNYFPIEIADVFMESVIPYRRLSNLRKSFLSYLSADDKAVLKEAITQFDQVDQDALLDVLGDLGCKVQPTSEFFLKVLDELAHKGLIQKTTFRINSWSTVLRNFISDNKLLEIYKNKRINSRNILSSISPNSSQTVKTDKNITYGYLKKFREESSVDTLKKIVWFCTGADDIIGKQIRTDFNDKEGLSKIPQAHTCSCLLEHPVIYNDYPNLDLTLILCSIIQNGPLTCVKMYAEIHNEIITNKFATHLQEKQNFENIWQYLANKLISLGQGKRSVEEWKKTLAEWKSKTKKKGKSKLQTIYKNWRRPSRYNSISSLKEKLIPLWAKQQFLEMIVLRKEESREKNPDVEEVSAVAEEEILDQLVDVTADPMLVLEDHTFTYDKIQEVQGSTAKIDVEAVYPERSSETTGILPNILVLNSSRIFIISIIIFIFEDAELRMAIDSFDYDDNMERMESTTENSQAGTSGTENQSSNNQEDEKEIILMVPEYLKFI
ncbi:unnamed protein product [Ceutorhynchus assimilis]|uniref:Regulatory protein zeste n=1 Tax=Ceutorhynchus assimilis TaxID=467358 RepID=A0A9N9MIM7_9CUCU|nr:unnamed protein product [Ceutorhynchus assimilis]